MERVLVIDDDKHVRDSLTLTLKCAGYAVSEAATVREGLAFHEQRPASVVITDEITVEHNGLEHVRELKRHSPFLPIIAISGSVPSTDKDGEDINSTLGAVCRLQKPFTVDEFLSTIKTVLPEPQFS